MSQQSPKKGAEGLGYPQIEKLLETEDFTAINKSFADAYNRLENLFHSSSQGVKKQKEAQKAMKSYELATELINELLQIKKEMLKKAQKKS